MVPSFASVAASQSQGGGWQTLVVVYGLLFLGMWFLLIAPQKKRQRNQQRMLDSLKSGDKVVTTSGIIGTVAGVKSSKILLKVAADTKIEIFKSYIHAKLDKSDKTDSFEKSE